MGRGKTNSPLRPRSASDGQRGAAGIRQPEQFGGLVEGLPGGIVQSLAQYPVAAQRRDIHELGMAAGHQQREERKGRRSGLEQGRQEMTLQVVNTQRGLAPRRT